MSIEVLRLRLNTGEQLELLKLGPAKYVCPVCGYGAVPEPPYDQTCAVGADPTREENLFATGSLESCPRCGTVFGNTDFSTDMTLRDKWKQLRRQWLDRERWSEQALHQLAETLGINEEELRRGEK